jgi:hypothetical protein
MTKDVKILRAISVYIGEDRIVIQPSNTYGKIWDGKDGIKCRNRFYGFQILTIRHSAPVSEILDAIDQMSDRCLDDVPAPTDEELLKTGLQLLLKEGVPKVFANGSPDGGYADTRGVLCWRV